MLGRDLVDSVTKIIATLELNVSPVGAAAWEYAWRRGGSMSDGIVPPLFCRHAAANWASDGNG